MFKKTGLAVVGCNKTKPNRANTSRATDARLHAYVMQESNLAGVDICVRFATLSLSLSSCCETDTFRLVYLFKGFEEVG